MFKFAKIYPLLQMSRQGLTLYCETICKQLNQSLDQQNLTLHTQPKSQSYHKKIHDRISLHAL